VYQSVASTTTATLTSLSLDLYESGFTAGEYNWKINYVMENSNSFEASGKKLCMVSPPQSPSALPNQSNSFGLVSSKDTAQYYVAKSDVTIVIETPAAFTLCPSFTVTRSLP
jgi:hypothetical protein